jgi:creatinine amidohydrolase
MWSPKDAKVPGKPQATVEKSMAKMRYQELLPHELADILRARPVAYLPLGTLEYHGPHLAIGNDALKAEAILERACARTGGVLVPTLYWGIGGGHKEYPTSVLIRDQLLADLLDDILDGLYRVGFRVYVLLTGHYPGEQVDAVKQAADRLRLRHPEAKAWALPEYEAYPRERRADHAAKWETSILMALHPELVDMAQLAGAAAPEAPEATRTLEEMNAPGPLHGILGQNPARYAHAALGEETVGAIVGNLVSWVEQALE